jgi:hypothetical protein
MFLHHTQRRTTFGKTPLNEWSVRRRDIPDNTLHSQQTSIHNPSGIRTYNLSWRAAANLRLRPHGHWHRLQIVYNTGYISRDKVQCIYYTVVVCGTTKGLTWKTHSTIGFQYCVFLGFREARYIHLQGWSNCFQIGLRNDTQESCKKRGQSEPRRVANDRSHCRPIGKLDTHCNVDIISVLLSWCLYACNFDCVILQPGARGGALVEALRYKPEGRGIDSRWCYWNFSFT